MALIDLKTREDYERMPDGTVEVFDVYSTTIRTVVPAFLAHLF